MTEQPSGPEQAIRSLVAAANDAIRLLRDVTTGAEAPATGALLSEDMKVRIARAEFLVQHAPPLLAELRQLWAAGFDTPRRRRRRERIEER